MSRLLLCLIGILVTNHLLTLTGGARQPDYKQDYAAYRNQANVSVAHRRHCDTDTCDQVVTKCTRTQKCPCDIRRDAACAKGCLDCLEEKFGKCCACVDLCPPLKENPRHSSHVGNLKNSSYEELFHVLTEKEDALKRWTIEVGASSKQIDHPDHGTMEMGFNGRNELVLNPSDFQDEDIIERPPNGGRLQSPKCIVAYISKQLDLNQCKSYCRAMGASAYRWFHEGCCECVGKFCIHYGIDKPKCHIDGQ